jgi:hypothetical protein
MGNEKQNRTQQQQRSIKMNIWEKKFIYKVKVNFYLFSYNFAFPSFHLPFHSFCAYLFISQLRDILVNVFFSYRRKAVCIFIFANASQPQQKRNEKQKKK